MDNERAVPPPITTIATVILAGAGTLCLLALGYFVYFYAWTRQRVLTGWAAVFLYYVCPPVFAALLFAALRLSARRKVRVALMLSSTVLMFYLSEALLTVPFAMPSVQQRMRQRVRATAVRARGIPFDTRTPQQVTDDLRARGFDAVRSLYPTAQFEKRFADLWKAKVRSNDVEILPLAGISNRLTVLCNESGEYATYRSDQHGFNNSPNLWNAAVDVVAIGDSGVQGMCVPTEKNFVSLIRQRYPATLNLGIQGNGPLVELATLKEYAEPFKPRLVLWFYNDNDFGGLKEEKTSPLLMRYLSDGFSQGLMGRQREIDDALTDFLKAAEARNADWTDLTELREVMRDLRQQPGATAMSVLKLIEVRTRLGLPIGQSTGPRLADSETVKLLGEVLADAKKSVERWGGRFYLVWLPSWDYYVPSGGIILPGRDEFLMTASELGIPTLDLYHSFLAHEPLSLFPPGWVSNHYNERGQRLVADEVLRFISTVSKNQQS
jgi:hypothetical protein